MKNKQGYNGGNAAADYTNMVNQNNWMDAVAEPFAAMADRPASNVDQKAENALMGGVAAGFKGAASNQREAKLAWLEEATKQVAMQEANLKMQVGKDETRKAELVNFTQQYKPELRKYNDAIKAGDEVSANNVMAKLAKGAMDNISGFKDQMGEFKFLYDGEAFFSKDGETRGVSVKDLFGDIAKALGDEARDFDQLTNSYTKQNFAESDFFKQQAMAEAELKNNQIRANIGVSNAHAGYYNAQTEEAKGAAQNPAKYSEQVLGNIQKENHAWVNTLHKEHKGLEKEANAYEKIAQLIERSKDTWGAAGSGVIARAKQVIASSNGEDRDRQLAEMYKQPIMKGIKEIFAGATSDRDAITFLATTPDFDKNPQAAIQVAKERSTEIRQRLKEDKLRRQVVERDYGYTEPYNSLAVEEKVQELMNQGQTQGQDGNPNAWVENQNSEQMVVMTSPDGSTYNVPSDKVEVFRQNGFK